MRNLFLLFLIISLLSCRQQKDDAFADNGPEIELGALSLPDRIDLMAETRQVIQPWVAFKDFDMSFVQLYQAENKEDLILVVEDLIAKHQELAASDPPERMNVAQVKSRMNVVLTNLYLLKEQIDYGNPVDEEMKSVVGSYNALRAQMNSQVTNKLDTKTLEDE